MRQLEEQLKNKFKDYQSLEGVDVEGIWQGVSGAIQPSLQETTQQKIIKHSKKILLLLFLLAIGGAFWGGYFYATTNATEGVDSNNSFAAKTATSPLHNIYDMEEKCIEEQGIDRSSTFAQNTTKAEQQIAEHSSALTTKAEQQIAEHSSALTQNAKHPQQQNVITAPDLAINYNLNNTKKSNISEVSDHKQTGSSIPEAITKEVSDLNLLQAPLVETLNHDLLNYNRFIKLDALDEYDLGLKTTQNKPNTIQINFSLGANQLFNTFNELNSDQILSSSILNDATSREFGFSSSLHIRRNINNLFHLTTGIEYHQTQSQFNRRTEWMTTQIINDNVYDALAVRTVIHHNRFNYITVPVLLGIHKQSGKIEMAMDFGIGLNYFVKQSGRSLDASNEISDISSNNKVYNDMFVSYQISPSVNYLLSNSLGFGLTGNIGFQNHGTSNLYNMSAKSIMTNIQTKVFMRF